MRINVFEGARRIALLISVLVSIVVIALNAMSDPYVSVNYNVSAPNAPFVRTDETCPPNAGSNYFPSKTKAGHSIGVTICLLPMAFGDKSEQLVPYKIDEKGMLWGAPSYSTEVDAYEQELENRFQLLESDDRQIESELSARYRKALLESLGYLAVGLAVFWALVWATGWVARGFDGIPRGKDSRPSQGEA
jgi:hypothetical protein